MVLKKGKKGKNCKKKSNDDGPERELIFKDAEGQEYAQVTKLLGNCRLECNCFDGIVRLVQIRGKTKRKERISMGDVILISLRDFEDKKADVIMKYTVKEVKRLKMLGEIPDGVKVNDAYVQGEDEEDDGIDFEENKEEEVEKEVMTKEKLDDIFDSI